MRNYMFLLLFLSYSSVSHAESEACDMPAEVNRFIDGPANVRERPDSDTLVMAELADKTKVTIVNCIIRVKNQKRLKWYYIEWSSGDKKMEGWTAEQNIR